MATRTVDAIARSVQKTEEWLSDLARELGTDDEAAAWRVLRAYLQVLRERLQSRVGDPSEATVAVLEQLAARAEALDAQERAITRFVHPR